MKYLFWNTHKNENINDVLSELIIENDISVVLLAEYTASADELINELALQHVDMFQYGSCSERIKMFGSIENIQYRSDTDHSVIRIINNKGIPVYEETKRKSRTVAGEEYYMFYNPMWNLLGDTQQPYGTYYYAGTNAVNTYWNIYDQVIIRPVLRERFAEDSLMIIKETQTRFLLDNKGHPNKKISDHLPIVFEIREE